MTDKAHNNILKGIIMMLLWIITLMLIAYASHTSEINCSYEWPDVGLAGELE